MSYFIENIFICLAAPFLIAAVILESGRKKSYIFIVSGMLACIVSAYLNTFFSGLYNAGGITATMEITPVIEDTAKLLYHGFRAGLRLCRGGGYSHRNRLCHV